MSMMLLRAAMPSTVMKPTSEPSEMMPSPVQTASTPPTSAAGSAMKISSASRRLANDACRIRKMRDRHDDRGESEARWRPRRALYSPSISG